MTISKGIVTKKDRWDLIRDAFLENNLLLGYFGHDEKLEDVDCAYYKSTINMEKFKQDLTRINAHHNISFIFSTAGNDRDVVLDASFEDWINENHSTLTYIGPSRKAAEICYSKSKTKEIFRRLNINTPKYLLVDTDIELEQINSFKFPLVRKEDNGWSGYKMNYYLSTQEFIDKKSEITYPSVIEEYIDGEEYSINLLRWNDSVSVFPTIYKGETSLYSHPLGKARIVPCQIDSKVEEEMIQIAKKLANKVDINGWIDFDFIYSKITKQIYILEINSRFSGSTRLINKCTEQNPYSLLLKKVLTDNELLESYSPRKLTIEVPTPAEYKPSSLDSEDYFFKSSTALNGLLTLSAYSKEKLVEKIKNNLEMYLTNEKINNIIETVSRKGKYKNE